MWNLLWGRGQQTSETKQRANLSYNPLSGFKVLHDNIHGINKFWIIWFIDKCSMQIKTSENRET